MGLGFQNGSDGLPGGYQSNHVFWVAFFPILDDFGSKMGVQKPSFLGSLDGIQTLKFRRKSDQVQDSHSGGILEGF